MEISKSAVLLANEHQSDQKKNVTNDFRINFRYFQWNARKCSIKEDLKQNCSLSIS